MKIHFTRADLEYEHVQRGAYMRALDSHGGAPGQFPQLPLKWLLWCSDLHEEVLLRKDRFATREPGFPGPTRYFESDGLSEGFSEFCRSLER